MASMMMPTRRQPRSRLSVSRIGLDIGGHNARIVERQTRHGVSQIVTARTCPLNWESITEPGQLAAKLIPVLREVCTAGCGTIVSFPSKTIEYECIAVDDADEASIRQTAQETIDRLLGAARNEAVYDFWCSPGYGRAASSTLMHLVWMNRGFVEHFAQCVADAGFPCLAVDAVAPALSRLVSAETDCSTPTLVVDISDGEVSFVCVVNHAVAYQRSRVRFASKSPEEHLEHSLGLRRDAARQLLIDWGVSRESDPAATEIGLLQERLLSTWLGGLSHEISRTISYLQQGGGMPRIGRLIMCGGGASVCGLDLWLRHSLALPVECVTLPADWEWRCAEPCSPGYAQAVALTQYGGAV